MSACSIDTNCFNHEQAFDFLRISAENHPDIFFRILEDSLSVPDCDLVRALALEEMLQSSTVSCHDGTVHFYIRSVPVPSHILGKLLDTWDEQGYHDPEMDAWRRRVDSLDVVWIRYIGQCKHPALPWDRHASDMVERTTGFFCRFFRDLEAMGYEAKRQVKVYQMVSARLSPGRPFHTADDRAADDRERILIHLFDHPTLLN